MRLRQSSHELGHPQPAVIQQPDQRVVARLVGDGFEQGEHSAFGEDAFGELLSLFQSDLGFG